MLEPGTACMLTAGVGLLLYRKRRPRSSTRR
ncbi:MAG: PEP-CTERM sorting domain-containing protein [Vicinamibacteria bacterium]